MTSSPGPVSRARTRAPAGRSLALALAVLFGLTALAGAAFWPLGHPRVSDGELKRLADERLAALKVAWDPRLFVLEAQARVDGGVVTLSGVVDGAKKPELLAAVKGVEGVRRVVDALTTLPAPDLGARTAGLVAVAVANLGDAPGQDTGKHLVTQARLADAVEVLRERDGWYQVRMADDGYLGWIKGESLALGEPSSVAAYAEGEQVLVTAKFADVVAPPTGGADPGGVPGDAAGADHLVLTAVMGTILPVTAQPPAGDRIAVTLPRGEVGWIRVAQVRRLPSAVTVFAEPRPAGDIIALAEQFIGLPYVWGGTTPLGFDCSGFVQFVFGLNGYRLPRDADMQYAVGTPVTGRADLEPGDIVFFSTYKEGPSHVGIYVGGSRFIHSGSAGVAVNSFDPKAPDYSEALDAKYLGARRVLGQSRWGS